MSDNSASLPSGFIDALIGYAIDPLQWEAFAEQLEKERASLRNLDTSTLLAALSQAETLAWELRGQPDLGINRSGCIFFLLDNQGGVVQASDSAATLQTYCHVVDDTLRFVSPASQRSFGEALEAVRKGKQRQALIELRDHLPYSRYGYLVNAADLPAAFNLQNESIRFGLLIAQSESSEQARGVLQTSFSLTAAETAICEQLSSGMQLKEVAQTLNISTNTARNHLQSVFDKTGTNRQGDLILMMTQLSVILSVIASHTDDARVPEPAQAYPAYQFAIVGEAAPRRMAFRTYGNGPNYVVYCHDSAGSSRLLPGTDALATRLGLTVIAPERPGSGFSDALEGYSFLTTAHDLMSLLDQLQLERISILGFLSGAAHALAAASLLGDRVQEVMLVAGRGPGGYAASDTSAVATLRRRLTEQPWLLATFFNILRSRANPEINRRLLLRIYGAVDHDRQLFLDRPDILDHMVGYTLESLTVSAGGLVGEIRCFTNPVPVDLAAITAPVTAWHGDADEMASFAALEKELASLQLDSRVFEGCGSVVIYEYWEEVLGHLAEAAAR